MSSKISAPNVLSFDPHKVIFDGPIVYKTTTKCEYDNLRAATAYLADHPMALAGGTTVRIVGVRGFEPDASGDRGRMALDREPGLDLESMVRAAMQRGERHHEAISRLIDEFIVACIENGFGWGEIAPRNIILDDSVRPSTITLVDFEKPARFGTTSAAWWARTLHGYVLEELSCLFPEKTVSRILAKHTDPVSEPRYLAKAQIISGRKRALIEAIMVGNFTSQDKYPTTVVRMAEHLMARAALPSLRHGRQVVTMDFIESRVKMLGYPWYVNFVLNRNHQTNLIQPADKITTSP